MTRIMYNKERTFGRAAKEIKPEIQATDVIAKSDLSQFLPLDVVKQKISEAVEFTKNSEQKRYEGGLKNLNDQLNESKQSVVFAEREVSRLRTRVQELEQLFTMQGGPDRISSLEKKLDMIYGKIADGSISPLVGSDMGRPALEDKIFIDPLDKGAGSELESHIDVQEEFGQKSRDVSSDVVKLRSLLKS